MTEVEIVDRLLVDLTAAQLHDIMKLRVDVFVVEQSCAYAEIDGHDDAPGTRHVWVADEAGLRSYARLLEEGDVRRIGRVATRADARGAGLAAALVDHLVATSEAPWVLDAQSRLQRWYRDRGFFVTGSEFFEDGIAHVPMRRDA